MSVRIALAGNPNSGKTTLFNALTGASQYVGNWPGVTVEKKEGKLKGHKDVTITDLPGIYSLSPYTLEEVISRNYLINEQPDAIIDIVDGTNLERNLYLTTQLLELGIPVLIAVNMMDTVNKNGDRIDTDALSEKLGAAVTKISALKGTGVADAAKKAVEIAGENQLPKRVPSFDPDTEHALSVIDALLPADIPDTKRRFYAIKLFERDEKISIASTASVGKETPSAKEFSAQNASGAVRDTAASGAVSGVTKSTSDSAPGDLKHMENQTTQVARDIESVIAETEKKLDDDSESIITNARYEFIAKVIKGCYHKKSKDALTISDKIDRVVTNRWLALPIFAVVMFVVYFITVSTVGAYATDWVNDELFTNIIPPAVEHLLDSIGCADWLQGLILDGIIAGLGAVLGFLPQMLLLFFFLACLESCGYMARVAFIMDRIFRKFGLSGKSFIPMLIATGCGVPAVMGSRTIENDRDRRMTVMTTTFIPCSAKLPIIALFASAIFGRSPWVAPSAYFVGVAAVICSGIILKKTKMFAGDPAPFVMELPAYHWPTLGNVFRSVWQRTKAFVKKAGTIILLSTIVVWFLSSFGFVNGRFCMVDDLGDGLLAVIGGAIAWIFKPLGWGNWKAAVAAITGLVAKENVVGTFGILHGFDELSADASEIWSYIASSFTAASGYSFLVFNLLCAPCFAAIGAIKREMNSAKWTWFAIGYQTALAYAASLCIYQFASAISNRTFGFGTVAALVVLAGFLYLLFRPNKERQPKKTRVAG